MNKMRNHINLIESTNDKLLTDQEKKIINLLADAYNEFIDLPNHHQNDTEEFTKYIHILQRQVMARLTRRLHPEMFK